MTVLHDWLRDNGKTQRALARSLEVTDAVVSKLMRKQRVTSWSTMRKLSELTSIPLDRLVEEYGSPSRTRQRKFTSGSTPATADTAESIPPVGGTASRDVVVR